MDKLWAPWRMKYIISHKNTGCIFCQMPKQNKDKKNHIIERKKFVYSVLNIFPYNNGHILVAPYKHTASLNKLTRPQIQELMELVTESMNLLKKKLKPHGFNVGINIGKVAGAGYDKHIHFHIVPRWDADTNFMPILADTKVIAQSLGQLYEVLTK